MTPRTRTIAWTKPEPAGAELAEVTLLPDRIEAHGVAIGGGQWGPYRLDYGLQTVEGFVTAWLSATVRGTGWTRSLRLIRDGPSGGWSAKRTESGEPPFRPIVDSLEPLAGALDCDLGLSPLTNTMPVLRHELLSGGGPVDFTMAWVAVPSLEVHLSRQRYSFVRAEADGYSVVHFETPGDTFEADITFDRDGLVVEYPGIGRRMA
jgi:hypothetical protein